MKFDFVGSWDLLYHDVFPNFQKWWNTGPDTYLLLKPGTDIKQFNAKIEKFINKYIDDNDFTLSVRPYSSAYLYGNYENGVQAGGRIEYVRLFSIVAIFILLIACINFMNLTTARSVKRSREIGIRKVVGAMRSSLRYQFVGEAILLAFFAIVVSLVIVALLLPTFNNITEKQILLPVNERNFWYSIVALALVTGIISGSYPAMFLSSLNPVRVLKGSLKFTTGAAWFRKGLVVFQFALSTILIVGTIVVSKQVNYIQSQNLGYDRENLIYIPLRVFKHSIHLFLILHPKHD